TLTDGDSATTVARIVPVFLVKAALLHGAPGTVGSQMPSAFSASVFFNPSLFPAPAPTRLNFTSLEIGDCSRTGVPTGTQTLPACSTSYCYPACSGQSVKHFTGDVLELSSHQRSIADTWL